MTDLFITINGIRVPVENAAPSQDWDRTYSGATPLPSGAYRQTYRDHRRVWSLRTKPLPSSWAETLSRFVIGNQHVGLFDRGLELSTGLAPIYLADVRLLDLALDWRGGGMKLLGATGARATGRVDYPAQLLGRWTVLWQETLDDGATWQGGGLRDDGVGYVDGAADVDAGGAATTLQVSVVGGTLRLDSGGVDVGVHGLVVAPYRIDEEWMQQLTLAGYSQHAPSPILEVRGTALPDGFRYAVGRRERHTFSPLVVDGVHDNAGRVVEFDLVELEEYGRIESRETEPVIAPPPPPPPLPESANVVFRVSALEPDGATNRPVDLGSFDMGVFPAATGATYSASAGPNGNPTWAFSGFPAGFTTSKAVSNTNTGVTVAVLLESRTTFAHNFFSISNVGFTTQDHYLARSGGVSFDKFAYDSVTTLEDAAASTPSSVWYLAVFSNGTSAGQNDGSLYRLGETSALASYTGLGSAEPTNSLNGTVYPVIGRLPAFDNDPGGSRVAEVIVWDKKIAQADFGEIVTYLNDRWAA